MAKIVMDPSTWARFERTFEDRPEVKIRKVRHRTVRPSMWPVRREKSKTFWTVVGRLVCQGLPRRPTPFSLALQTKESFFQFFTRTIQTRKERASRYPHYT